MRWALRTDIQRIHMRATLHKQGMMGFGEFVSLMALIMCMVALSIDMMLPALDQIATDLLVEESNDIQWVLGILFLGVAFGQLIYGPLADAHGRKAAVYLGFAIFILGTLFAMLAPDLATLLVGRFLQGLGAAGPRIVTLAIVRDQFTGRDMARVLSLIMTIFILCPVVAPLLGQGVLLLTGWRELFGVLLIGAVGALTWFGVRQPETLPVSARIPVSKRRIQASLSEMLRHRGTLSSMVALGLVFGAFIGFLATVQPLLQNVYGLGRYFPVCFALLAFSIGSASYCNSRLVMRFGMYALAKVATAVITLSSVLTLPVFIVFEGVPPLWGWILYLLPVLFCVGLLFGNLNALAMEPFGHFAGVASAMVGAGSTFIAVLIGASVGQMYGGTVLPVAVGFGVFSGAAFYLIRYGAMSPYEQKAGVDI